MDGYIKLHRKLIDWEWYKDLPTKTLYIHLLLKANWMTKAFKGVEIPSGTVVTSIRVFLLMEELASEVTSYLSDVKPSGTGDFALTGHTLKGWTEVYLYIGSSKYNTKEMARLIDYVVEECKPLGIDTMTPDEIERLKAAWTQS